MRRNPQHVAWTVLILSFLIFCVLSIGGPLGIRWYIAHAERRNEATVESLLGTVVVEPPVGRESVPLGKGQSMSVPEGTTIRADETSEAVITFFDHSFMRLFPGTMVRLEMMRSPRFAAGRVTPFIRMVLQNGRVSLGTALSGELPTELRLETLHAVAYLDADGSYAALALNDRSEFTVNNRGRARIIAAGQEIILGPRKRTEVLLGQPPAQAMDAARNLVLNSDFRKSLEGWRVYNDQGTDGGTVDGTVRQVIDGGRPAVLFQRTGGDGNHCETVLEQTLDQQLPDPVTSLIVRATVKVRYQSLAGGGYLSSEYPLMIRLTYRDVYDSEAEWVQGFYYRADPNTPTMYGQQIPQDRWVLFESPNLIEALPVTPYRLIRLRVYASGWDYESLISDINVIVE
ncbi:MAG: hypothetical protein H5T69_16645 [Chloroflexi bacterium]|nr:hypothetical protein [Chloroflexota bacterium]